LDVLLRLPLVLPYPAALPRTAEHGNGLRRPQLPSGRTLVLDGSTARPRALRRTALGEPRFASPRLASSRSTTPRRTSLRLACSRPRRVSVSYIALAFVLIISNGAAVRERNMSIADARYYARRNSSLSHVHALGYHK